MNSASWKIRRATTDDIEALVDFNCAIARETEDRELERGLVARGVTRAFQQGDEVTYYVAEAGSELIGGLMLTREWSDWRDGVFWWIQSVYVAENARRLGVFKSLYQHVEELARNSGNACGIRLYVEQHNARAQETYHSLGMQKTDYYLYETDFSDS